MIVKTMGLSLLLVIWFTQTAHPQTAAASVPIADSTPIPLKRAVVLSYSDDGMIEVQETGKDAARLRLAVQPVFLRTDNTSFEPSSATLWRGTKVLLHVMQDGNETIVDRVILD